jgi:hypothetical protein
MKDAVCQARRLSVVRDEDDPSPLIGHLAQKPEHRGAGLFVEVAGGFVGENEGRIVDECPDDREPLLLTARKRLRQSARGLRQTQIIDEPRGAFDGTIPVAYQSRRQEDVLEPRQLRQQVERLEDEPDLLPAQRDEHSIGRTVDARPGDLDQPGVCDIEPAEEVQERRFPGPRPADDGDELTARHVEVGAVKDADASRATTVRLDEPARVNDQTPHDGRIGPIATSTAHLHVRLAGRGLQSLPRRLLLASQGQGRPRGRSKRARAPSRDGNERDLVRFASSCGAQQVWFTSVIELVGDRLPALSIAWTENVFEACVP